LLPATLVAASCNRKLTRDCCEDALDFISEPDQNRYRDDGNKSQYQGVLDEGLAFFSLFWAAKYFFVIHPASLSFSKLKSARRRMKMA